MSAHTPTDAATLVMDSAEGFESLLEAAGTAAVARSENTCTTKSNQPISGAAPAKALGAFDNRPTWDNPTATFDNRPTWDNWKNK
ncbi:hypothetical protein MRQ86_00085 [Streptomyces sp. MMS21 TC-5]|uniref:multiple cyclophane-containing RiPP AmcA n=1 Tax=Streptomyces sp. MMS21 TC-5 TaxID=2925833 RepID=UPI001F612FBC|nr:multiple cyclophane-containing RiPP AmcA [Streptomyces sp. MMS21 TC-5]MCI4078780.1 hypothetical protein [Streptomyces sp. MMS21 TC-5]